MAHLQGYESSILGKTHHLMCGAIGNMLGFTHSELVEHIWGISLGTLWEHTWNMMGTQNESNRNRITHPIANGCVVSRKGKGQKKGT